MGQSRAIIKGHNRYKALVTTLVPHPSLLPPWPWNTCHSYPTTFIPPLIISLSLLPMVVHPLTNTHTHSEYKMTAGTAVHYNSAVERTELRPSILPASTNIQSHNQLPSFWSRSKTRNVSHNHGQWWKWQLKGWRIVAFHSCERDVLDTFSFDQRDLGLNLFLVFIPLVVSILPLDNVVPP